MITLSDNEFVAAIKQVAAENPDYVYVNHYPTCEYYREVGEAYQPRCIIGKAFDILGVDPTEIYGRTARNGAAVAALNESTVTDLIRWNVLDGLSNNVIRFANSVQAAQDDVDNEISWSQCVAEAEPLLGK